MTSFGIKWPRSQGRADQARLIDWLGFSGTFSTVRLYRALKIYSLVKRLIPVRQLKILRFGECNNMCESWDLGQEMWNGFRMDLKWVGSQNSARQSSTSECHLLNVCHGVQSRMKYKNLFYIYLAACHSIDGPEIHRSWKIQQVNKPQLSKSVVDVICHT